MQCMVAMLSVPMHVGCPCVANLQQSFGLIYCSSMATLMARPCKRATDAGVSRWGAGLTTPPCSPANAPQCPLIMRGPCGRCRIVLHGCWQPFDPWARPGQGAYQCAVQGGHSPMRPGMQPQAWQIINKCGALEPCKPWRAPNGGYWVVTSTW